MTRKIPNGSKEIQEGLFLYEYSKVVCGKTFNFWQLHSAEGYHFYDNTQPIEDENGNEIPRFYHFLAFIPYGTDLSCYVSERIGGGNNGN